MNNLTVFLAAKFAVRCIDFIKWKCRLTFMAVFGPDYGEIVVLFCKKMTGLVAIITRKLHNVYALMMKSYLLIKK